MQLNGIHHVTAITGEIKRNLGFYTQFLGLRLVKKTVNQDDVSAYHLFYADKNGSPGTDITFFDWPEIDKEEQGTDSVITTIFRVPDSPALDYWQKRLASHQITHIRLNAPADRDALIFSDFEGQRLMLMADGDQPFEGELWDGSNVPPEFALRGFYAVVLSVPTHDALDPILTQVLKMRRMDDPQPFMGKPLTIYEMGEGGPGRELWVVEEPEKNRARPGAGGIHHVALRVADNDEQRFWHERLLSADMRTSDVIDRFYFRSLYFRVSRGILFEIATDGPGFTADEDSAALGDKLALPPFLENQRKQIEAGLKPL